MAPIIIYSTPTCPFCHQVKDFFKEHQVEFVDYNVADDETKRDEMVQKSGQLGVPVIDVGGEVIVGFDKERLQALLHLH